MKTKYLGKFEREYIIDGSSYEDIIEDTLSEIEIFINTEDESDYYESELFMRQSEIIEGIGEIHAVCGETNNSSIVLQFDEDDSEYVKLWRVW